MQRLNISNKIAQAAIDKGDHHTKHKLFENKFARLVAFYEKLGFETKTALNLARKGCGKNSTNPDTHYYVVDGKLVGCSQITSH